MPDTPIAVMPAGLPSAPSAPVAVAGGGNPSAPSAPVNTAGAGTVSAPGSPVAVVAENPPSETGRAILGTWAATAGVGTSSAAASFQLVRNTPGDDLMWSSTGDHDPSGGPNIAVPYALFFYNGGPFRNDERWWLMFYSGTGFPLGNFRTAVTTEQDPDEIPELVAYQNSTGTPSIGPNIVGPDAPPAVQAGGMPSAPSAPVGVQG